MKVLLSSIGSRGDVQPILALGVELQALGHKARICAAPNFGAWIESHGLEFVPIGPDLKKLTGGVVTEKPALPSPEQFQQLAVQTVLGQFQVLNEAVRGCDLALGAGALQIALRSIAEAQKIPYIFAAYCPAVLPSPRIPPPKTGGSHPQDLPESENLKLWQNNAAEFDTRFLATLNEERAKLGLAAVESVQPHIFTSRPWLAADPFLAPAYAAPGLEVVQTGAWLLSDPTPLPEEVENFLAAGDPPVYLGFGSMRAADHTADMLLAAARSLGLRSILSQGWAGLRPDGVGDDCLSIGDVDHSKLFPRLAAILHHGGAGTTTTAALAGTPQVVIPHNYDQFYWAHRVRELGVGFSGPTRDEMNVESIREALRGCLQPAIASRARELANRIEPHGARIAAERIISEFQ